ncbi:hypothetical protein QZH41_008158, partial [Actinostola sp. cb2023]
DPLIVEINGIKIGFLGYCSTYRRNLDSEGHVCYHCVKKREELDAGPAIYTDEAAMRDVNHLKDKVDIIVVMMHWGVEYVTTPTKRQQKQAAHLQSIDVHVVIGCHPHVLEGHAINGKSLVSFSLGNLLYGPKYKNKASTRVLQGFSKGSPRVLQGFYKASTRVLQGFYKGSTRVLQGRDLQGISKGSARVLQGFCKGSGAVLLDIERGLLKWDDSFLHLESRILYGGPRLAPSKPISATPTLFCRDFQKNACSHSRDHYGLVKGVRKWVKHICATCWVQNRNLAYHREGSADCPIKSPSGSSELASKN